MPQCVSCPERRPGPDAAVHERARRYDLFRRVVGQIDRVRSSRKSLQQYAVVRAVVLLLQYVYDALRDPILDVLHRAGTLGRAETRLISRRMICGGI